MRLPHLTAIAAVASLAASTQAAVVFTDNFDTYANQAAFEVVWPAVTAGAPGLLSTDQAVSAPNSVSIPTNGTSATRRSRRTFAETAADTNNQVVWSFDFYDGASTAAPYRNYANLQDGTAPSATNQLISMGLNNNQSSIESGGNFYMARILGYTPTVVDPDGGPDTANTAGAIASGAYFKLNDTGVGTRTTGWHNLKVIISTDGTNADYLFYVDNQLAETVSNVGTAASAIRSFDNIAIGSGVSSTTSAFFDNMSLSVVPEPTTLAAAGLLGTLLRRRR